MKSGKDQWLTKNISEREIIRNADEFKVFNETLTAKDLNYLYSSRNAIVHRFVITDIDYELSKRMSGLYEPYIQHLNKIVQKTEKEELTAISSKDIGFSSTDEKNAQSNLLIGVKKKIGDTLEKIDRVRSHQWTDVEDVVEYAQRQGYLKECICGHHKINHVYFDDMKSPKIMTMGKCWTNSCSCEKYKNKQVDKAELEDIE